MPTLKIPTPLRPYAEGQSTIVVSGENVAEILEAAVELHPALKKHLYNDDRQLRPFVNIFLGEDNVNQLNGMETRLKEDDILLIIPSIAGGQAAKDK
jgi:molybdopterin converting factor small subunit